MVWWELSRTLKRVVVESTRSGRQGLAILMELEGAYRETVREVVECTVKGNVESLANPHRVLYGQPR